MIRFNDDSIFMVFDVESLGLHGESFSVGWSVVRRNGSEIAHATYACDYDDPDIGFFDPESAPAVSPEDEKWVRDNVKFSQGFNCRSPIEVRDEFWRAFLYSKTRGATLWAECLWPVEANFLSACIADQPEMRKFEGPYPLHEIATVRAIAGFDPTATEPRLPREMPIHCPLADARQSARLLIEALNVIEGR